MRKRERNSGKERKGSLFPCIQLGKLNPLLFFLNIGFIFVKHSQHGFSTSCQVCLIKCSTQIPTKTEAKTCCQSISPVCADVGYIQTCTNQLTAEVPTFVRASSQPLSGTSVSPWEMPSCCHFLQQTTPPMEKETQIKVQHLDAEKKKKKEANYFKHLFFALYFLH